MSAPACPFCGTRTVARVGLWGGQIVTAQWRCEACGSYFEALREDFEEAEASRGATPPGPGAAGRLR